MDFVKCDRHAKYMWLSYITISENYKTNFFFFFCQANFILFSRLLFLGQ